jgi:hypothetical protein
MVDNDNEPEVTPVRRSKTKEEKIIEFIQNIIKKTYLRGRNSYLKRKNTHSMEYKKSVDGEDEEEKLTENFIRNTMNFSDCPSEDEDVGNEPKIGLIRCSGSLVSPFIKPSLPTLLGTPRIVDKSSINERDVSLAFYDYAMKNHKELFEHLKVSYMKWREGIDEFDRKDGELSMFNASSKTYK